jgi:hypothetical protein
VGDGLVRVGCNSGFELPEKIRQSLVLAAGLDLADSLDVELKSTIWQVSAEDVKDRGTGQYGEVGPDREVALFPAQQPAGPRVRAAPGDIAAEVERQAGMEGRPSAEHCLDRVHLR